MVSVVSYSMVAAVPRVASGGTAACSQEHGGNSATCGAWLRRTPAAGAI